MFSNKSKAADAELKIKMFKQSKKHIADFIIEFKILDIKAETDDMYTIFLVKKNVKTDIIKTILGCSLMSVPEILREWNVVITLVRQGYKSTES